MPTSSSATGSSSAGTWGCSGRPPPAGLTCAAGERWDALLVAARQLEDWRPQLCVAGVVLPRQGTSWDCGYVVLGSILRCLVSRQPALADRVGPNVFRMHGAVDGTAERLAIQKLVTSAWREDNFDPEGAQEQNFSLVGRTGKRAWLSPVEAVVLAWHLRIEAFLIEVVARSGAGQAVYNAAAACFASGHRSGTKRKHGEEPAEEAPTQQREACSARLPIMLTHQGHTVLLLGVLTAPSRLVIRDPQGDLPNDITIVEPHRLDGRQYELLVCGQPEPIRPLPPGESSLELSAERARGRRGQPLEPAALYDKGRWQYSPWCSLRFV